MIKKTDNRYKLLFNVNKLFKAKKSKAYIENTLDPEFPKAPVPAYILLSSFPLFTHMDRNISLNRETMFGLSVRFKSINWYCKVSSPKNVWTLFVRSKQSVQLVLTVPYCCLKMQS